MASLSATLKADTFSMFSVTKTSLHRKSIFLLFTLHMLCTVYCYIAALIMSYGINTDKGHIKTGQETEGKMSCTLYAKSINSHRNILVNLWNILNQRLRLKVSNLKQTCSRVSLVFSSPSILFNSGNEIFVPGWTTLDRYSLRERSYPCIKIIKNNNTVLLIDRRSSFG